MSWIYVAVGIACLVVLQLLRGGLSIVFPTYSVRPIRKPDPASFGGLELVDKKISAYNSLGFEGPAWLGCDHVPAGADAVTAHAAFRNRDERIVAWLGPTVDMTRPNQLLTYYTTLLEDGRYAVTQVSDPYFEAVADPMTPAHTIEAGDEAAEIARHRRFVAELGVRPANSTPKEDVLHFAAEHMNGIRQRLLERGDLSEADGIARPGFRFAFRLLKAIQSRPKPKKAALPGNPTVAHLGFLAKVVELAKSRAPAQHVQWQLMAISVVLSVAIGWPVFGLEFTIIVVAVIAFHEAGHWLAMRLFGYGNPHITLLPLVGGVAIGHENSPNAAHRAWVALAGPLPGIVLGWLLLFWASTASTDMYFGDGALFLTAVILLFVNYLNVLPIPPLDGHHVVQAILPPRWVMLQVLLIAVGVALGAYVAGQLDFWPLALIAALQLLGVRALWRQARIVSDIKTRPVPDIDNEASARTWLFGKLGQRLGPAANPAERVGLANAVLSQLRLEPMGGLQRTVVSTVYALLLVVPIVALLLTTSLPFGVDPYQEDPEVSAIYEAMDDSYDQLLAEASQKDLPTLLDELCKDSPPASPASDRTLTDLRDRLQAEMPAGLDSFYRNRNGACKNLEIAPAEALEPLDPSLLTAGELKHFVYSDELIFWHTDRDMHAVPVSETHDWWLLGKSETGVRYALLDPAPQDGAAAYYVIGELGGTVYFSVDEWLRDAWASQRYEAVYTEFEMRLLDIQRRKVADLGVSELLDLYPKPNFLLRLIIPQAPLNDPASADQIAAVEALVGRPLPADHREALEIHNGFPGAAILATDQIVTATELTADEHQSAIELAIGAELAGFDERSLTSCWIVGGYVSPAVDNIPAVLTPALIWCPNTTEGQRYLSLNRDTVYASYIEALRDYTAPLTAY